MNSEFTVAQAELVRRAQYAKQAGDNPKPRSRPAGKLAFGRPPSAAERETALDYLRRNSLPRLCLLIFNMSEFIYVD